MTRRALLLLSTVVALAMTLSAPVSARDPNTAEWARKVTASSINCNSNGTWTAWFALRSTVKSVASNSAAYRQHADLKLESQRPNGTWKTQANVHKDGPVFHKSNTPSATLFEVKKITDQATALGGEWRAFYRVKLFRVQTGPDALVWDSGPGPQLNSLTASCFGGA